MKRLFLKITVMLLFVTSSIYSQENQPFVFTLYGGLFFPSHPDFKSVYQSSNDIILGSGICLPVHRLVFASGDISFFKSKGLVNPATDSTAELSERFIHVGVISKQLLTSGIFLRLSGGLSYISIKQTVSGSNSTQHSIDADKKVGYYGGIGFEEPLDPEGRASLFADVIYDYRRSQKKELYGDFGGVRLVLGVHLFLF